MYILGAIFLIVSMSFVQEFKSFIMKGNVIDLAVAVVIGAAFKPVISTLVDNVIMPPIGLALGGVNFSELKYVLQEAQGEVAEVAIGYGAFLQSVIDFVIIGFCIFIVVKVFQSMQKKEEPKPEAPKGPTEVELLEEIRDLMKKKS